MLAPHPPNGTHHRGMVASIARGYCSNRNLPGYSPPGKEKVSQHLYDEESLSSFRATQGPDVKESFECGREDDPAMPNIWLPESIDDGSGFTSTAFEKACLTFFWVSRHESYLNMHP
jgi:hypothetical protein